jgi:hypothetical protein
MRAGMLFSQPSFFLTEGQRPANVGYQPNVSMTCPVHGGTDCPSPPREDVQ